MTTYEELQAQRQSIQQARARLPVINKRQLRTTGLQGRVQRRQVKAQEAQFQTQEKQIAEQERVLQEQQKTQIAQEARKQIRAEMDRVLQEKSKGVFINLGAGQKLLQLSDEELTQRVTSGEPIQVAKINTPFRKETVTTSSFIITQDKIGQALGMSIAPELLTEKQKQDVAKYEAREYLLGQGMSTAEIKPTSTVSLPETQISESQIRSQELMQKRIQNQLTVKESAELLGIGVASSLSGTASYFKRLGTNFVPTLKETVLGVKEIGKRTVSGQGFPELGKALTSQPEYSTGFVAGELIGAKGAGLAVKGIKLGATQVITRLDPRYSEFATEGLKVGETTIKEAGSVSKLGIPLSQQAEISGKTINAVSAQRNLFGLLEKEKIVRKSIGEESQLTAKTKEMLNKFDEGKLKQSEYAELNKRLAQEAGSKGLLERSFFADPYGRIRISRLGVIETPQKKASLIDILSGDVTTKADKPQILLFENTQVEKLPKLLEQKLLSGKPLTEIEQQKLLRFQLTPSGKFKPIGFLSREPEVTISPSEIIKKQQVKAVTLIEGKRVPVITAYIGQPSVETSNLLGATELTINEGKRLGKLLAKETGLSLPNSKPYIDLSESSASIIVPVSAGIKPSQEISTSKIISTKPSLDLKYRTYSSYKTTKYYDTPIAKSSYTITKYPVPKYPTPKYPTPKYPVPKYPTPKIPSSQRKPDKILEKLKVSRLYKLFLKRKGKYQAVNKLLTKGEALELGAKITTSNLGATFKVAPTSKFTTRVSKQYQPSKEQFRTYRIVKGKRVALKDEFIQRASKRLSSKSEVSEILRSKRKWIGF